MQFEYILTAVGDNRPGVVAEITKALYFSGCNIENSNMTLLLDHFTLMIHIMVSGEDVYEELRRRCEVLQREKELKIHIFPMGRQEFVHTSGMVLQPQYEIRIRGMNKEGIVYRTSQLLAARGINILKLSTKVERSPQLNYPLFTMRVEIEVPKEMDGRTLRRDLESLSEDLQETISLTRKRE